ncbi:MAG: arginine N-succinyltransferase [Myxococcales bacterium]|nr:arginine N-succinyltransferase [Myxococcales bacterium]
MRLRSARASDHEPLLRLARELNSINLATEPERLRRQIETSEASFAGSRGDRGDYLIVLEAPDGSGRPIGCAMILGKHGTPEEPHYYLSVRSEHRYSDQLLRGFRSKGLYLGWNEDGPSELGGLILAPEARGHGAGKPLSLVRLLYMAVRPERFQKQVIAEMLGRYDEAGHSPFWDYYGRKVTGLDIHAADMLCTQNKEFIRELFVEGPLYTALMPEEVQDVIGHVGKQTEPALAMLLAQGMRDLHQIDPFDGGPFIGAHVADLAMVRAHGVGRLAEGEVPTPERPTRLMLIEGKDGIVASAGAVAVDGDEVRIDAAAREALGVPAGTRVHHAPLNPKAEAKS